MIHKFGLTNNDDLTHLANLLNIEQFRGVIMRDQFQRMQKNTALIVNLDSSRGPGTHWCAIIRAYNNHYIWFDPFAIEAPQQISDICGPDLFFCTTRIQDMDSNLCGYFCIAFIYHFFLDKNKHKPITDTIEKFYLGFDLADFKINDAIIKNFINKAISKEQK